MSEWKFLTLKEAELEFIDGDRGVNYPKKSELLPEGDCVFLNTGNVRQNSFDFSNLDFITKEKDNLLRNGKLQRDDIVLTTRGTVGNVALYSQEVPFSNIRINSGMVIIRVNKNFWHPYFIYLFFQSHLFKKQISRLISGSAQPQLPISILETVSIPQLTLDEQKEIIFNIKSIDQKIQINNQINQELEAMAKTLYDYWFVQFDFPDQNGKPYKSSGGKMVYHPELKREIPEGWGVEKLSHFLTIKNGKDHKHLQDGEFAVYGSGGIMRTVTDYLYSGESILFPRKGTLNNVMYVNEKFWTVDTMFYSEVNKNNSALYVFYSVKDIDFNKLNTGTGVPSMTSSILYDLSIIVPEENILEKFNTVVKRNYETIKLNNIQNQELVQLRDWLLPMLMNGQVKV